MLLRALMYPLGRWDEPCDVACDCGLIVRVATCREAQRVALQHNDDHARGLTGTQLPFFRRGPVRSNSCDY